MLGSPSASWDYLVQCYSISSAPEKTKIKREGQTLEMNVGEPPLVFFGRAKLIRHQRERFGLFSDSDVNCQCVRGLSSKCDVQRGILLDMGEIDTQTLERVGNYSLARNCLTGQLSKGLHSSGKATCEEPVQ